MPTDSTTKYKPLLKWAGGKIRIADKIAAKIKIDESSTYFEPFVGGGSVFFRLKPKSAILGDSNKRLIDFYRTLRDDPEKLYKLTKTLLKNHTNESYYLERFALNKGREGTAIQAARFLYLNKSGFNGIYRVNRHGDYNVPIGSRMFIECPSKETFEHHAQCLKHATLIDGDFESIVESAKNGDTIYFDPPYPAISETSFFAHYTAIRFGPEEQIRLAECAEKLRSRGCRVIISNADTKEIRRLYKNWFIEQINIRRWISAGKEKKLVDELIISSGG